MKRSNPSARTVTARSRSTKKTSAKAATATAALYAVTTHATPSIVVWKRAYSSGSASTTIEESAKAIPTATATSATAIGEPTPGARIIPGALRAGRDLHADGRPAEADSHCGRWQTASMLLPSASWT